MNQEKTVLIDNQIVPVSETKTVISFNLPTPLWAKWVFRIVAILTTVALFIIAGDPGISDDTKIRVAVYLKGLDMAVLGLSKMFGITKDEG